MALATRTRPVLSASSAGGGVTSTGPQAGPTGGLPFGPTPPRGGPATTLKTVVIEGGLDWKKWLDFYDGVIMPLVTSGATVRLYVRADGAPNAGIPRNVVEIQIRENVSQRGLAVRVLSETEEQQGKR